MTRTVWLLDANLLIALTHAAHVHHQEAHAWFGAVAKRAWATCALTQLAFVRLSCNPRLTGDESVTPPQAMQALAALAAHPHHEYWADAPPPVETATLAHPAFVGHRQTTDAYLLALAVARSQRLATLDRGIASFASAGGWSRHVELVSAPLTAQEPKARYARRAR